MYILITRRVSYRYIICINTGPLCDSVFAYF